MVLWGADENSLHFPQTKQSCVFIRIKKISYSSTRIYYGKADSPDKVKM